MTLLNNFLESNRRFTFALSAGPKFRREVYSLNRVFSGGPSENRWTTEMAEFV